MDKKTELFERMPVPKAIMTLAVPTILSQLVTMIYSLTDAFFIGRTGNPYMVAAVALSFSLNIMMFSLSCLFGVGGGSLISRLLGEKRPQDAKHVSSFSFWAGVAVTLVFSLAAFLMLDQILLLSGATGNTLAYAHSFTFWVVIVGGVPASAGMLLSSFLRSEGYAKEASIGVAGGSVLNCILEPIFIFGLQMNVTGAGIATMLASVCSMVYYIIVLAKLGDRSVLSISPRYIKLPWEYVRKIIAVGFPAALQPLLAALSTGIINKLASGYGDIPVASIGINKRIDMVPLSIGNGLSQGILPLMAYSFAAKDYGRMRAISKVGSLSVLFISLFFVILYQLIPEQIIGIFITDRETIRQGAGLLRIACTVVPFMQVNVLLITTFQAMGKGLQSLVLSACRQGIIAIPLLFLMNRLIGLPGLLWTQTIADILSLGLSLVLYTSILRRLRAAENALGA